MTQVDEMPRTIVTATASKKHARYDCLFGSQGTEDGTLNPVILTTLGGWDSNVDKCFRRVVAGMASQSQAPRSFFNAITFQRLAACIVRLNVACLT